MSDAAPGAQAGSVDNGGVHCTHERFCSLCGSPGKLLHGGLSDHEFGAPGVWSVRRCTAPDCGLAWLDPRPLTAEIGKLYARYYTHTVDSADDGSPELRSYDSTGAKKLLKQCLAALFFWRRAAFQSDRNYLQGVPPGRLLDVGCGNGLFMGSMARLGWSAHGIDFDANALMQAQRYAGVTTAQGDLVEQALPPASFDAIHLGNVIEHLPEPASTLAECHRLLKPGGRLVLITPNIDSLGHRLFGPDWRGLEAPRHLFLFNGRSLSRLARSAGFVAPRVFSVPGDRAGAGYIVEQSAHNARAAGRVPPRVAVRSLMLKERALDLAGRRVGEWIVLIARR